MKKFAIYCLLGALLPACSLLNQSKPITVDHPSDRLVEAPETFDNVEDAYGVLNGTWVIVAVGGNAVTSPDPERPLEVTINLAPATGVGSLYCFTGCNYLNGDVAFLPKGGKVEPRDNFMSTMMACTPEAEAVERSIASALAEMRTFTLVSDAGRWTLRLYGKEADGTPLLELQRGDLDALNGAWEVTAVGSRAVSREDDLQLVIDLPLLRLHGTTGCNVINGTVVLPAAKRNAIEFCNIATTLRGCPDDRAALERSLLVVLESVATVSIDASDPERATLLDAAGTPILRLHRLALKR